MINNISLQKILKTFEQNTAVKKTSAASSPNAVSDKLELSAQGINLQALSDGKAPEVSEDKLTQLRDAVARGEYKIDNNKLADALIAQNIIES